MAQKSFKYKALIMVITIYIVIMAFSVSYAYWWGDPGYQWARSNGLTGAKTRAQLDAPVELDDLYATIISYLQKHNKLPNNKSISHEDKMEGMDNVAKGYCDRINSFNSRKSIKIQDFYRVCEYASEGYAQLDKYKSLSQTLTREDLQNLETYLRLSKYRAALLIDDRSDREYALSTLGYVKNSLIVNYGIIPYTTYLTRIEFLNVMYDLMSDNRSSSALDAFYDPKNSRDNVLIGYDIGLELDRTLSYTEMYAFLQRMESFDFKKNAPKNALSDMEEYVDKAYEGLISRNVLIKYLMDVAENTNYQIDLYTRLNEELGSDWTTREAGILLYDIIHNEGLSYEDGRKKIVDLKVTD